MIVLGAILGGIAPFVHMLFSADSTEEFFGFSNMYIFLFAVAPYITIFFFSIVMLLSIPYIHQYNIKNAITISSMSLLTLSCYFFIYALWPDSDLPVALYHGSMVIGSIIASFIAYHLIVNQNRINNYLSVIWKLTDFITIDVRKRYVKEEEEKAYLKDVKELNENLS